MVAALTERFFAHQKFAEIKGKMAKILLAEDDKNLGSVLKTELEESQYNVDLVPNGVEAVLSFISTSYDFVLLDMLMPRLSGIDALRIMKRIDPHIPVITFSGTARKEEQEESVRCGAIKWLAKPFAIAELKNEIRSHLLHKDGGAPR